MYKECIMSEMEGKSIPYTTKPVQTPVNNEERSKVVDCLVRKNNCQKQFLENFIIHSQFLDQIERRRKKG